MNKPETIKVLKDVSESLEREREDLIRERRAAAVFIEEQRKKRAKSYSVQRTK
jgi:hypothetical protein